MARLRSPTVHATMLYDMSVKHPKDTLFLWVLASPTYKGTLVEKVGIVRPRWRENLSIATTLCHLLSQSKPVEMAHDNGSNHVSCRLSGARFSAPVDVELL